MKHTIIFTTSIFKMKKLILLLSIVILFIGCTRLTYENCSKIYKPLIIDKTFVITDTVKVSGDTITTYIDITNQMFLDSLATVYEDSILHLKAHYNSITGGIDTKIVIKDRIISYNTCDSSKFINTMDSLLKLNYERRDSIYEIVSEIKELREGSGDPTSLKYILITIIIVELVLLGYVFYRAKSIK